MRVVFSIILIFLYTANTVSAQYGDIASDLFNSVKKLDSTINLNDFDYDLINLAVLHYTNIHRKNKRKKQLIYNKTLEKSALLHSLEMDKYNFFSHINRRNKKFKNLEDRAKFVGYKSYKELAENLYYGFIDFDDMPTYKELGQTITNAFIVSRSHNLNLIDKDLKEIGTYLVFKDNLEDGFLYYYFTQSFGTR